MREYEKSVKRQFGDRIWFIGLQGSYGRGEATESSDIDVVLILDRLSAKDVEAYASLLDPMPCREKICGFISGKEEVMSWEPSDLFQFCRDTVPIFGSLDSLFGHIHRTDIHRAIHMGACNIYHMCVHNMIHEKNGEVLRDLYKSAVFPLQAVGYLQTGIYDRKSAELKERLSPEDRRILEIAIKLKTAKSCPSDDFLPLSRILMEWASGWICRQGEERQTGQSDQPKIHHTVNCIRSGSDSSISRKSGTEGNP